MILGACMLLFTPFIGASTDSFSGRATTTEGLPLEDRTLHAVPAERIGEVLEDTPWVATSRETRAAAKGGGALVASAEVGEDGEFLFVGLRPGAYRVYAVPGEPCLPGTQLLALNEPIELPATEVELRFAVHELEVRLLDEHGNDLPRAKAPDFSSEERAIGDPNWISLVELDALGVAMPEFASPLRVRTSDQSVRWQVLPDRDYALIAAYPDRPLRVERLKSAERPGRVLRELRLDPVAEDGELVFDLRNRHECHVEVREASTGALLQGYEPKVGEQKAIRLGPGRYRLRVRFGPFYFWCDHGYEYPRSHIRPHERTLDVESGSRHELPVVGEGGGRLCIQHRSAGDSALPFRGMDGEFDFTNLDTWTLYRGTPGVGGAAWYRRSGTEEWRRLTFFWPGSTRPSSMRSFVQGTSNLNFDMLEAGRYELHVRVPGEVPIGREFEIRPGEESVVEIEGRASAVR